MSASSSPPHLIWATRGHSWGFRFLLDAGFDDPLAEYERAFADVTDTPSTWATTGDSVALRFPDPQGRRDSAGRSIPHEFVLVGELAKQIHSVDDGLRQVWPLVEDAFARTWMLPTAPQTADLGLTD